MKIITHMSYVTCQEITHTTCHFPRMSSVSAQSVCPSRVYVRLECMSVQSVHVRPGCVSAQIVS